MFNPLVDAPVILIDTSKQRIVGPDHLNDTVHEAAVHELVRGLQYEGVLPGRKAGDVPAGERATDRLAVIAPYRAQVQALKSSLAYRFGKSYEGLVGTVHRLQGSQRPIVILDTTAGSVRSPGSFFNGSGLSEALRPPARALVAQFPVAEPGLQAVVAGVAAPVAVLPRMGAEGPPCCRRARTSVPAPGPASAATSSATTTRKPGTAWLPAHWASGRTTKWSGAWGT
ncbi:AAA domain-containing protein [Streptomyces hirsutus]|uniref:AAA domain-containing protein n=1 Tax=Streptomyces hirsutus TaxID=35620 RepID=UPI003400AA0E